MARSWRSYVRSGGAEDSELEEDQHTLMHEIGLWTRQRFGCSIHFDGKRYEQRCQIDIAHRRFGFSVGYTATAICSICGDDVSGCPHLPDKEYWIRGGVWAPRGIARCAWRKPIASTGLTGSTV